MASLQDEHEALLGFLYMCPVGVVRLSTNGDVQLINPHAAQLLLPLTRTPSLRNLFEALEACAPELRDMAMRFSGPPGQICNQHRIFISRSGPGPWVVACTLLKIGNDDLMAVLQDVTKQVELERQLRQNDAMSTALTASGKDFALLSLDSDGLIDSWNSSGRQQTGYGMADVLGRDLRIFSVPEGNDRIDSVADQLEDASRAGWSLRERWCKRRDGSRYWCQIMVTANRVMDDEVEYATPGKDPRRRSAIAGFAVVLRDVTERHVSGEELRRLLTTDHLTGATNRARFFELADIEITRNRRGRHPVSALMLDVDGFKNINIRFGQAGGDLLLKDLVTVCRAHLRPDDVLARMGGEEFAILLPGVGLTEAVQIAERIRHAAASPAALLDTGLNRDAPSTAAVTISIGCASMSKSINGVDALLKAADAALHTAKRGGRNQVRADTQDDVGASQNLTEA